MPFDVIIVLAGGLTDDSQLPTSVQRRVERACSIYLAGLSSRIILSGKYSSYWTHRAPKQTEAQAMYSYARLLHVPATDLQKEESSTNTVTNIVSCRDAFLRPNGWRQLCVVTSDFHVRRTKLVCDAVLGDQYSIHYEGVRSTNNPIKWVIWNVKEWLLRRTTQRQLAELNLSAL